MSETNRRMLVQRLSIGGLLAATGCDVLGINSAMAPADPSEFIPWNDPSMEARASRSPPPLHLPNWHELGHSLSPDGALLATPLPGDPVNHLAVIELASRRGWRLAHPNYRVKLTQPTFSPDGQSIAFIVTPPNYYGTAEIWITGIRGGDVRVIASSPAHSYRNPTFSPDSGKLAYLKDVQAGPIPEARHPVRREYRSGLPYALFELDLRTRMETRMALQAWADVGFLAYSPNEDGFYLATNMPMHRYLRENDGAEMWNYSDDSAENYRRQDGTTGYFLPRGTEVPESPASIIPDEIAGRGQRRGGRYRLSGVDRSRRMLIEAHSSVSDEPSAILSTALVWDGHRVHTIFERNDIYFAQPSISYDGRSVIAPVTSLDEIAFLARLPNGGADQLDLAELTFESAPLFVESLEDSELAQ